MGAFSFHESAEPDESRFAAHITRPIVGRATLQTVTLDPPMPAWQRLPTLMAGVRTHADWHQAAVGPCHRRRLERPLFEVQRS